MQGKLTLALAVTALASPTMYNARAGMTYTLQGAADKLTGRDADHAGRAANYFDVDNPLDEAIYFSASDWAAGHDPNASEIWPKSDGLINWSLWDEQEDDPADQGPRVVTHDGRMVYFDPSGQQFVIYNDDASANPSHEKLWYRNNVQQVGPLSFGNNGTPSGAPANRQIALLSQFKLDRVNEAGRSPDDLLGATFTIHIDDVINMDLVSTDGALPSLGFVNVYEAQGDLINYEAAQAAFDQANAALADAVADLVYNDPGLGEMPVTDFALTRNTLINGKSTLRIDFDVTDAVRALLSGGASFLGLTLTGSDDGDFTLGSIDPVVTDSSGDEVLVNLLPSLTIEFQDVLGDFDGNGVLDAFDVAPFETALADKDAFIAENPDLDPDVLGDFNGDLVFDAFDVAGFEAALSQGSAAAVPEPASIALIGLGLLALPRRRK